MVDGERERVPVLVGLRKGSLEERERGSRL